MKDVNYILKEAIIETGELHSGEEFLLKDLFKGYEWNRIPFKDRLLLGTLFLNNVISEQFGIEAIKKTSSNQQKYRKK
ncbi:MAG: single-stranded DNA-binding protein [Oscillospiraceae bacterium]